MTFVTLNVVPRIGDERKKNDRVRNGTSCSSSSWSADMRTNSSMNGCQQQENMAELLEFCVAFL